MRGKVVGVVALLAALLAGPPAPAVAGEDEPGGGPPQWFRDELAFMVQGSGRWITDNAPYKSEAEPYDEYGMEWKYGLGKISMKGRLFGLVDGKEVATFWEFRSYWHPGEKKVHVFQIGGHGVVGTGTMESEGPGKTRVSQTFFNPDGSSNVLGHLSEDRGKEHITQSYNITPGGEWKERRRYVWRLQEE